MIDKKDKNIFYVLSDKPRLDFGNIGSIGICKIFRQKVDAVLERMVGVEKPKKIYRVTAELSFKVCKEVDKQ